MFRHQVETKIVQWYSIKFVQILEFSPSDLQYQLFVLFNS